jgi:archaemetzincin
MFVSILPIGNISRNDLQDLITRLSKFKFQIGLLPPAKIPADAYEPYRKQYDSAYFLDITQNAEGDKVLGITDVDLFTPHLNFIFGQAEIRGKCAVISIYRLKWNASREKFVDRMVKEAVHELGHTFGLQHCRDRKCVMCFSNRLLDTDNKSDFFCSKCVKLLPPRIV